MDPETLLFQQLDVVGTSLHQALPGREVPGPAADTGGSAAEPSDQDERDAHGVH